VANAYEKTTDFGFQKSFKPRLSETASLSFSHPHHDLLEHFENRQIQLRCLGFLWVNNKQLASLNSTTKLTDNNLDIAISSFAYQVLSHKSAH
jgi:hypothetical protein